MQKEKQTKQAAIPNDLGRCVDFHGHLCPGVTIGYLAAKIGMQKMRWKRASDEELICIAMSDTCAVDAVQYMTGCTVGKGNLFVQDYGKMVFIFLTRRRESPAQGIRLSFQAPPAMKNMRRSKRTSKETVALSLLGIPAEKLFNLRRLKKYPLPERARIFPSRACDRCGELTMEPRLTLCEGKLLCMECAPAGYSR